MHADIEFNITRNAITLGYFATQLKNFGKSTLPE